jgi:hypothetical protein
MVVGRQERSASTTNSKQINRTGVSLKLKQKKIKIGAIIIK